jgi:hypothetical protein
MGVHLFVDARKRKKYIASMTKAKRQRQDGRRANGAARRAAWSAAHLEVDCALGNLHSLGICGAVAGDHGCPDDKVHLFLETLEGIRRYLKARSLGRYASPPGGVGGRK